MLHLGRQQRGELLEALLHLGAGEPADLDQAHAPPGALRRLLGGDIHGDRVGLLDMVEAPDIEQHDLVVGDAEPGALLAARGGIALLGREGGAVDAQGDQRQLSARTDLAAGELRHIDRIFLEDANHRRLARGAGADQRVPFLHRRDHQPADRGHRRLVRQGVIDPADGKAALAQPAPQPGEIAEIGSRPEQRAGGRHLHHLGGQEALGPRSRRRVRGDETLEQIEVGGGGGQADEGIGAAMFNVGTQESFRRRLAPDQRTRDIVVLADIGDDRLGGLGRSGGGFAH